MTVRTPLNQPIVLTGCGWVTPLAAGTLDDVLACLRQAVSAPVLVHGCWTVPESLRDQGPELSDELTKDHGGWLAGLAFVHARRAAAWREGAFQPERVGLVLGCALAGQPGMIGFAREVRQQTARFVSPLHFPQTVGNYVAGALARGFDLRGPNLTLASGEASGLDALAEAFELLGADLADVVLAGAIAECPPNLASGLAGSGVVLSEGACLFVLERAESAAARGAVPLATMAGYTRSPATEFQAALRPALLSCAARGRVGAVFIEQWVGRSPGTTGVAAVAAAIGAARGQPVPVLDAADPVSVSVRPVALDDLRNDDGTVRAFVQAATDGGHMTTLELAIPARTSM